MLLHCGVRPLCILCCVIVHSLTYSAFFQSPPQVYACAAGTRRSAFVGPCQVGVVHFMSVFYTWARARMCCVDSCVIFAPCSSSDTCCSFFVYFRSCSPSDMLLCRTPPAARASAATRTLTALCTYLLCIFLDGVRVSLLTIQRPSPFPGTRARAAPGGSGARRRRRKAALPPSAGLRSAVTPHGATTSTRPWAAGPARWSAARPRVASSRARSARAPTPSAACASPRRRCPRPLLRYVLPSHYPLECS